MSPDRQKRERLTQDQVLTVNEQYDSVTKLLSHLDELSDRLTRVADDIDKSIKVYKGDVTHERSA